MSTIAKTPGIAFRVIAEYVPGPSLARLKRRPDEIVFFAGQHREVEPLSCERSAAAALGNRNRALDREASRHWSP
jgi:hypothetical protein